MSGKIEYNLKYMTKINQIYKCEVCGNIVEMVHVGQGELVCCGQPMNLLSEKQEEEGQEKHVPVVEKIDKGVIIKIGSIPHPMTEDHFIEWVELITEDGFVFRKFLKPSDEPQAEFFLDKKIKQVRIYCNIHRLWSNK